MCLIRNEKFIVSSGSEGAILLFKWGKFEESSARILGHPNSVDTMVKLDDRTLITGSEDGFVRGVSVFPNKIIATLGIF